MHGIVHGNKFHLSAFLIAIFGVALFSLGTFGFLSQTLPNHAETPFRILDISTNYAGAADVSQIKGVLEQEIMERKSEVKSVTLDTGQSLWSLAQSLNPDATNQEVIDTVTELARANSINIPEWGINGGQFDHRELPAGFSIQLVGS